MDLHFEFGIVVELFELPRPELDSWYSFEVCGLERGPLRATGGVNILPRKGLTGLSEAERGARLVSICSGIFVLAATGLLNNKRATTHWRYIDKVSRVFPAIQLQPDVLYVDEGDILGG
jgi:AraC family transcriptional regulator, transcriptional activator FtrA